MKHNNRYNVFLYFFVFFISFTNVAADGKLIGTAGLSQVEGSGGGGIVPWATLAGYDSRDQISISAYSSVVSLQDYRLNLIGASASFYDKVEVSIAKQNFKLKSLGGEIRQQVYGLKYRVYGDIIYSQFPQLSIGMQHKALQDKAIAKTLGAESTTGTDFYMAATKVHLGAVRGYNLVWNLTARASKANELGLLGFGGPANNDYDLMLEGSLGLFLSRNLAIGIEYRQKPDNLNLKEDDWQDLFISYIPNKNFNVTLAWTKLGSIAGSDAQSGVYFSIQGQLW